MFIQGDICHSIFMHFMPEHEILIVIRLLAYYARFITNPSASTVPDWAKSEDVKTFLFIGKTDLKIESSITFEHITNNQDVKGLLLKIGIKP
jgi:hypothetical protein